MLFGHLGRLAFERQIQSVHPGRLAVPMALLGAAIVLLVAIGVATS